uniref:EF-hand domain-containing protein n=1 Tax=Colobus angolensis palliatus TaxID=336983 RepID=A0A2K5JHC0_COLAP
MAQLLSSILSVIDVFHKYAKENGDCTLLCKEELKQLLLAEFGDILQRPNDPETVETILNLLDQDQDGHVDFHEYLLLVFQLVQACYRKLDNKSYGGRISQQERGQEGAQDRKFPGNTGTQHRQRHEEERQNSHHSQSERQDRDSHYSQPERQDRDSHHDHQPERQDRDSHHSQPGRQDRDSHHNQSEKQDKDFSFDQSERQSQDSSSGSGKKVSHKSTRGQTKWQGHIFALNGCEKPVQDSHYGQSERLAQQSETFGQDSRFNRTNQQKSGSYCGQSGRLGQELGCGQTDRQDQSYHYGQTDRQDQSSHYGQMDRQGQSSHYNQTDRQGQSSHYGQTNRQGQCYHYGQTDRQGQRQSYHYGQTDREGQSSRYVQSQTGEIQGQNKYFQGTEGTRKASYVEQSGRSGRLSQQTPGQEGYQNQGQGFQSRDSQENSHQVWEPEEDSQHHQYKLLAHIQQERPRCHKGRDWQSCSNEQGHRQAKTRQSHGEGQSHWAEEEQSHQSWDRHSHEGQKGPCGTQDRQIHEDEQNHQRRDRQTHEDEQNHQRQDRQTHEDEQNRQRRDRQTHEDEQNHQR